MILCCGAIHSPAMLLRAGIGPVGAFARPGHPGARASPGVGQRLMDHPSISVASYLKPGARKNPYSKRSLHLGMRFSSGIDGAPAGDMALTVSNKSAWHAIGDRIAVITLWVNKTFSETGQVRLASADWRQEPSVDFNLLSDHRDLLRLAEGFRQIAALHELPPLKAITSDVFPASFTDKIRQVGTYNTKNRILTSIGAVLMDGPASLRQLHHPRLHHGIRRVGRARCAMMMRWRPTSSAPAVGVWHCSCSCRMGAEDDPMAVTDQAGRVRGVHGLRVVDASIFPVVPCANTNFPTMMAAEKIADDMLHGQAA